MNIKPKQMIQIKNFSEASIGRSGTGSIVSFFPPMIGNLIILPIQQMTIEPHNFKFKNEDYNGSKISCFSKIYFTEEDPNTLLERINS